ncbi:MAG: amino acid ABC transporter substrate-binding protein, partial [Chloroflexi bacterium]|nr:amino acid ABC transporter substrate-binding protein [Chloroflexota bacterium]
MMRLILLVCLSIVTALLSACASESEQQQAQVQAAAETTEQASQPDAEPGPLKIAFLGDLTGGLAEIGVEMREGFLLAIEHINAAGGVFGQPVEFVIGDTNTDPTIAIEEARRMIEIEGAHVIVGAHSSTNSLAVAESITGPAGVPQI